MKATKNATVVESSNEVMDSRIVKLNEFKNVKMANLSKGKRPAAKENKELAVYILINWDNLSELLDIKSEDVKNEEIKSILDSRLKNFLDADKAAKKAIEENAVFYDVNGVQIKKGDMLEDLSEGFEGQVNEVFEDEGKLAVNVDGTTIYLEDIDNSVYSKVVVIQTKKAPVTKLSENTIAYIKREWGKNIKEEDFSKKELGEIVSKLENLGITNIMKINFYLNHSVGAIRKSKNPNQVKNEAPVKKAPEAKKTEEVKKETVKTVTSTKKVGDIHPNGKWAWTEYAAGKFDWRTIPTLKQKTGAKPKTDKPEAKKVSEKSAQAKKNVAKQPKAKEAKKNEPEVKKEFTTSDFIAMPKARRGDKLSKAQEEALKLILKGYWIWNNGGSYFFKNEAGETKSCNMESVIAMFKKYGIVKLPVDLVK